ncbi:AAA family ATPase [uncultured Gemmiger sp.]|uniref:AAA family ATPase n=1 Tax=uncultured Gemmiger sp. TaxID=1623490 RepID=UPI0025D5F4A3|nr:AAA family ATPase [uncultured Gemmiger sp.]
MALYLTRFRFPDREAEWRFFARQRMTCYDSYYPFRVLAGRGISELEFEPVTILYGGNGCGKTTALNVMAEKLGLARDAAFNRTSFLPDYLRLCSADGGEPPPGSRIITSDDVFSWMLDLRALNDGIDRRREEVFAEYTDARYAHFQLHSLEDYEQLKRANAARSKSKSRYTRGQLMGNVRTRSNGESAMLYFTQKITENALYLLDEPENSLAPARVLELADFLQDATRFFGCQLVIATHSPFLLALKGAKVYDLDADPPRPRRWTELENVQLYRRFFASHAGEFNEPDGGQAERGRG